MSPWRSTQLHLWHCKQLPGLHGWLYFWSIQTLAREIIGLCTVRTRNRCDGIQWSFSPTKLDSLYHFHAHGAAPYRTTAVVTSFQLDSTRRLAASSSIKYQLVVHRMSLQSLHCALLFPLIDLSRLGQSPVCESRLKSLPSSNRARPCVRFVEYILVQCWKACLIQNACQLAWEPLQDFDL